MARRSSRFAAIVFTAFAFALAASTAWLSWQWLSRGGSANATTPIVVAARRIEAGHPFKAEDLRLVPWPSESVPQGSFLDTAALLRPVARVPTGGLAAGEPVLEERLASPQAGPGLAALVTPNRRAVAVRVDRELSAAHLIYPGAHVDVIATLHSPSGSLVTSRTVIQDVRVLAVGSFADIEAVRRGDGQRAGGNDGLAPSQDDGQDVVTLEILPQEAETLSLVVREGKIDLALRNATDHGMDATNGAVSEDVLRTRKAPAPAPVDVVEDAPISRKSRSKPRTIRAASERRAETTRGRDALPTP